MTLQRAREDARRAKNEALAWESLYRMLREILEYTERGMLL